MPAVVHWAFIYTTAWLNKLSTCLTNTAHELTFVTTRLTITNEPLQITLPRDRTCVYRDFPDVFLKHTCIRSLCYVSVQKA